MKNSVGSLIKIYRQNKGISQRELARRVKSNTATISRIESDITEKPNLILLIRLAEELEINEVELLTAAKYSIEEISDAGIIENVEFKGVKGTEKINKYQTTIKGTNYLDIIKILKGYKKGELTEIETINLISVATNTRLDQYVFDRNKPERKQ